MEDKIKDQEIKDQEIAQREEAEQIEKEELAGTPTITVKTQKLLTVFYKHLQPDEENVSLQKLNELLERNGSSILSQIVSPNNKRQTGFVVIYCLEYLMTKGINQ